MERLLQILGEPLCLQIVERLLTGPPETQENLRKELGADKRLMSDSINRLIDGKLVSRERARGPCFLLRREQVYELLQRAADLESEIARNDAERKAKRARALRKTQLNAPNDWADTEAAS